MRLTALIAASFAALSLAACQNNTEKAAEDAAAPDAAAADATAASTEAASASGPAASSIGSGSTARSGETLSSSAITTPSSGATVATVDRPAAAGANQTDTERRLNPQPNTVPAQ